MTRICTDLVCGTPFTTALTVIVPEAVKSVAVQVLSHPPSVSGDPPSGCQIQA